MTYRSVALTGHRNLAPQPARWLRGRILDTLRQYPPGTAECGMAYGADMAFGFAAVTCGWRLHAHIPYLQQPDRWSPRRRDDWRILRGHAETETVYGDLAGVEPERQKFEAYRLLQARNEGMVDACDLLLAAWDGRRDGGTWNCLRYAARVRPDLPVVWFNLADRTEQAMCAADLIKDVPGLPANQQSLPIEGA